MSSGEPLTASFVNARSVAENWAHLSLTTVRNMLLIILYIKAACTDPAINIL